MNSLEVINNVSEFKEGEFCVAFHKMIFENNANVTDKNVLINMARPVSCFKMAISMTIGAFILYPVLYAIGYFFF